MPDVRRRQATVDVTSRPRSQGDTGTLLPVAAPPPLVFFAIRTRDLTLFVPSLVARALNAAVLRRAIVFTHFLARAALD